MQFIFPKPVEWATFEDIVCDVFVRKYHTLNLQRYGRRGQGQQGVDIAGWTQQGVLGVQCKHYPNGNVPTSEIDKELRSSETFLPRLSLYIFVTSADRDTTAHSHTLQLRANREADGNYPIEIMFWQDICEWLKEFPDLVYKHFTKFFPIRELEHVPLAPFANRSKSTVDWPFTYEELVQATNKTLGGVQKIDPYQITVGFRTFESTDFTGNVDVDISLAGFLTRTDYDQTFIEAAQILKDVRTVITTSFFSQQLLIYTKTRITYAFLFGWIFRNVTGFSLSVVAGEEVWPSQGIVLTASLLSDDFPLIYNLSNNEVVLVLDVNRQLKKSVLEYVSRWDYQPKAILRYSVDGGRVTSSAHALSIALEVSRRIKHLFDNWEVRKIHLFGSIPAALAILIGHHLNAIRPIAIYFHDEPNNTYHVGGTLTNQL